MFIYIYKREYTPLTRDILGICAALWNMHYGICIMEYVWLHMAIIHQRFTLDPNPTLDCFTHDWLVVSN